MQLADRVIFIDGEAIVVDKPAGLPVDPPRDGSLAVANHLASLCFGFARMPQPVHRLDRDTSGCLLLARNPKAHKRFQAAFEAGTVKKTYLAVVAGVPDEASGTIDLPLAKVSSKAGGWRMRPDPMGKAAKTCWRVLGTADGQALVEFRPLSGRTHQLRVHAAHGLGLPILGDPVYGQGTGPMMLHAWRLHLPRNGKSAIEAEAALPPHFERFASLPGAK